MCYNDFFAKNFRKTNPVAYTPASCQAFSDNLYNSCKGVTHLFLNIGTDKDKIFRTVSDVELAMSTSPSVRSVIPPALQANLRLALGSMRKSGVSSPVAVPNGLELDERVSLGKSMLAKFSDLSNPLDPAPVDSSGLTDDDHESPDSTLSSSAS